jgi:hypothetical protein
VVYVATLDVTTAKAGFGGDVWVGYSGAKAEMATVDEVTIGEAEIGVDRDGFQVSPGVLALDTEQRVMEKGNRTDGRVQWHNSD